MPVADQDWGLPLTRKHKKTRAPRPLESVLLRGAAGLLALGLVALALPAITWVERAPSPEALRLGLAGLIAADVALVLLMGGHLLRRRLVEPIREMAGAAAAIADGESERRLSPAGAQELRKLAESVNLMADRLIRNQEQLRENVRSLDSTNRQLSLARRELIQAEKLATAGRVAAGIAHEVGNPLGAIMGYLEVARRRGDGESEWVVGIGEEVDRIDRVVRGLLDFARPKPAYTRTFDVNEVVEQVVELLRGQGRLKTVRLEVELDSSGPSVTGDPTHLEQILVNLLLNAGDAIEEARAPGRVVVTTSISTLEAIRRHEAARRADDPEGVDYSHLRQHRRSPDAVDRFEASDRLVRIEVWDNGAGIEPGDLPSLFEPFFTTKDPGRGHGLGLAVSSRLAESMGGALTVESKRSEGTRFTLLLPSVHAVEGQVAGEGAA